MFSQLHRQCLIKLVKGFRFISVTIVMSLLKVIPRGCASFDVQLKFESLLSVMFDGHIEPMRKTVHWSLLSLNPDNYVGK